MSEHTIKSGVHVSIAGSIDQAVDRALERDCDTFQIFTRNPRGWKFKRLVSKEVIQFRLKLEASRIGPAVAHMPYLPNLSSPKKSIYKRSVRALTVELERCNSLGIPFLVTHLGSHLGEGREIGLERLIGAVDAALGSSEGETMLLLENTAGGRNSMGSSIEDLVEIIDHVADKSRVGVCFDTCHAYAAGYDLRNRDSIGEVVTQLRRVSLRKLKVIHVNDAKGGLGSHLDRHEHIGMGQIGEEGFRAILHAAAFRRLPMILETPIDRRATDVMNLRTLRELAC